METNKSVLTQINDLLSDSNQEFTTNLDALKAIYSNLQGLDIGRTFTAITGNPFSSGAGTDFTLSNLSIKEKFAMTFTTTFAANSTSLTFKVNGSPVLVFSYVGQNTSTVYNFEMENLNGLVVVRLSRIDGYNTTKLDFQRMIFTDWDEVTSLSFVADNNYSDDTVYYASYK